MVYFYISICLRQTKITYLSSSCGDLQKLKSGFNVIRSFDLIWSDKLPAYFHAKDSTVFLTKSVRVGIFSSNLLKTIYYNPENGLKDNPIR
jgi:hypothetical protein